MVIGQIQETGRWGQAVSLSKKKKKMWLMIIWKSGPT